MCKIRSIKWTKCGHTHGPFFEPCRYPNQERHQVLNLETKKITNCCSTDCCQEHITSKQKALAALAEKRSKEAKSVDDNAFRDARDARERAINKHVQCLKSFAEGKGFTNALRAELGKSALKIHRIVLPMDKNGHLLTTLPPTAAFYESLQKDYEDSETGKNDDDAYVASQASSGHAQSTAVQTSTGSNLPQAGYTVTQQPSVYGQTVVGSSRTKIAPQPPTVSGSLQSSISSQGSAGVIAPLGSTHQSSEAQSNMDSYTHMYEALPASKRRAPSSQGSQSSEGGEAILDEDAARIRLSQTKKQIDDAVNQLNAPEPSDDHISPEDVEALKHFGIDLYARRCLILEDVAAQCPQMQRTLKEQREILPDWPQDRLARMWNGVQTVQDIVRQQQDLQRKWFLGRGSDMQGAVMARIHSLRQQQHTQRQDSSQSTSAQGRARNPAGSEAPDDPTSSTSSRQVPQSKQRHFASPDSIGEQQRDSVSRRKKP